jgi:hypothetical protein
MAGRKILDETDAQRCLDAQVASGLTLAEWARHEGVDGRSLNSWRMNLARRRALPRAPRLVELVPARARAAKYTVRCGRLEVDVGDDFDEDTLFRLLQVVAAC